MSINKEELKNKILYRASYRGTKEMDILLSTFVKSLIENLNINELNMLNQLVNIDDENLYKYINSLDVLLPIPFKLLISDNKYS